jgi:magnesium chelatase family protein
LAHGGILFLDEFPEFRRDVLEGLREPLENGYITVSRAKLKVIWQAQVLLITACNNCPCGWFGSNRRKCRCGVPQLISYRQRISGPILDRIDVHINMPDKELNHENLFTSLSETSNGQTQMMRERVNSARQFAADRNSAFGIRRNCDIPARHLKDVAKIGEQDFSAAIRCLSAQDCTRRSIVRSFRVARTIADLDESDNVAQRHWEKAAAWTAQAAARNRGELIGGI